MKLEINIKKKHLYIFSALVGLLCIGILVFAVTGNTAPDPGHSYRDVALGPIDIISDDKLVIDGELFIKGDDDTQKKVRSLSDISIDWYSASCDKDGCSTTGRGKCKYYHITKECPEGSQVIGCAGHISGQGDNGEFYGVVKKGNGCKARAWKGAGDSCGWELHVYTSCLTVP